MKSLNKIIFTLFLLLLIPVLNVRAASNLTIDDKSYNENTKVLTVSGESSFSEVMVSIFDGDNLLSFKTVTASNNEYNATFNIGFDEDKTVTIKVGDINSTDYEIDTLDVKKTVEPVKSNKLTDNDGNSLTIIKTDKKFEIDNQLVIQMLDDFDSLSASDKATLEAAQQKLGPNKDLFGVMIIMVVDGDFDDVDLDDISSGYELFMNMPEEALNGLNKPFMARLLDEDNMTIEDGKSIDYSSDKNGFIATLNNVGVYLLYDDISSEYSFIDNTGNQTFDKAKDGNVVLKINADYNKFVDLYIDNKKVDKKNYTVDEGSTVITLSKDYLKTLSNGKHNIKAEFNDGEANTTLTITDTTKGNNPTTNDNMYKWIILFTISIVGMTAGTIKFKRLNTK